MDAEAAEHGAIAESAHRRGARLRAANLGSRGGAWRALRDRFAPGRLRPRGLGNPTFDLRRRGELLSLTYALGALAAVAAWAIDPAVVSSSAGLATVVVVVVASAAIMHFRRDRLPPWTGDAAIVGSLVLIDLAMFFTKLHTYPMLFSPFYVWVGFASPLWFSRRRSALYGLLAVLASGLVVTVSDTRAALAGWVITMATLIVAFCITDFLTDALVQRERLAIVGEMASVVGHDLRNPLGAVGNALYLLRHGAKDTPEDRERHLAMGEREIAKATAIIAHLGAFVRPVKPALELVDLSAVVAEVLEATPPPQRVVLSTTTPAITFRADRGLVAEVLTNLLTNAYDALQDGGTVLVSTFDDDRFAYLAVEDDGPGIDRSLEERVFEPFFTTKHRGTGLGLAIVRRLVDAHEGSIHIERPAGGGTRFVVRVPLSSRRGDPTDSSGSRARDGRSPWSRRDQGTRRQYMKQSSAPTASGIRPRQTQPSSS